MRFEIISNQLVESLQSSIGILPAHTTYPVLQNVLFEVTEDKKFSLSATDLDTFIRKTISLENVKEPGRAILPFKKLLEICSLLDPSAEISFYTQKETVNLESGNSRYTFALLDPEEFPEFPTLPKGREFKFPVSELKMLFDYTGFSTSKDESRPALSGTLWEIRPNETRMVASDGISLAFCSKDGDFSEIDEFKAILGTKIFNLLPKTDETLTIVYDESKIGVMGKDITIISRLIEGPYPEYELILKRSNPYRLKLNRENFERGLRRAAVLAIGKNHELSLGLSKKGVTITVKASDIGMGIEALDGNYDGEDLSIGFNVIKLLEILNRLTDTEEVIIELASHEAAGFIKPGTDPEGLTRRFILMPVILRDY